MIATYGGVIANLRFRGGLGSDEPEDKKPVNRLGAFIYAIIISIGIFLLFGVPYFIATA